MTVLGDYLPISIRNKFFIVFAILRQLHLALTLLSWTYFSSSYIPPDVYIVDQLSTAIPLLRWFARTRVIFYCHFPDLLLSPGRSGYDSGIAGKERKSLLRAIYRLPIDQLEEATTGELPSFNFSTFFLADDVFRRLAGQADRILVNSHYTATMFRSVFPNVRRQLQIVYPGIKSKDFQGSPPQLQDPLKM